MPKTIVAVVQIDGTEVHVSTGCVDNAKAIRQALGRLRQEDPNSYWRADRDKVEVLYYIFPDGTRLEPEAAFVRCEQEQVALKLAREQARQQEEDELLDEVEPRPTMRQEVDTIVDELSSLDPEEARQRLAELEGTPLHGLVVAAYTAAEEE